MAEQLVTQEMIDKISDPASKLLLKIVDKAASAIDASVTFLSEQIPEIIHQLLIYNFAISLIWSIIGVIGLVLCARWFFYCANVLRTEMRKVNKWEANSLDKKPGDFICIDGDGGEFLFGCVVSSLLGVIFFLIITNNMDWLKIWLAPKIYLIEYTTDLYKSMVTK